MIKNLRENFFSENLSRHARRRRQQRSIPPAVIDALLDFGERQPAGGGSISVFFTKRAWRRFTSYMGTAIIGYERYRNCYLIEASDGCIVTTAFRY